MRGSPFVPQWAAAVWSLVLATALVSDVAAACSRVLYVSPSGQVITGRTMEWYEDQHPSLWVFPRGLEQNGKGAAVKKLPVSDNKIRAGDVTADFVAAKPFTFLPE